MIRLVSLLAVAGLPAFAQDIDQQMKSMGNAVSLGTVLASEEPCGLTLDPTGIEAWIAANVDKSDLSFASTLSLMTMGQGGQITAMTASAKIAHCATVKMTAGSMGLVK